MKRMISLIAFAFLATTQAFAGQIESGLFFAQDLEGGEIKAQIQLNEDKTVSFRIATTDYVMPAPGCQGTYQVEGDLLSAAMSCPDTGLGDINVTLDITNVTPESVRSPEGARVDVTIDLIGNDPMPFTVKKIDQPVFPE